LAVLAVLLATRAAFTCSGDVMTTDVDDCFPLKIPDACCGDDAMTTAVVDRVLLKRDVSWR
jgi:hypothetical protein